ncbi:PUA-like domain protein [Metarhizium album ARSEF 1941]|uniref:PUA-like domain protein n=1 Tax=Metarhizium album (strain ARSEF 1941) TaxID=1081103 RepID=A0A0B2WX36_METAS|nr:PUA-like domain protein [Metarhizium album ARSEF 1941]KHO00767.1 PUA-like domain protein [Metarhizium album ARSEF 1941]
MTSRQSSLAHARADGNPEHVQNFESQLQDTNFEEHSTQSEMLLDVPAQQKDAHRLLPDSQDQQHEGEDGRYPNRNLIPRQIRDIVRLFQCRQCSKPLKNAVTLPCGRSICRACVPATHLRTSITYPAIPDRLRGFGCPFVDCSKEHVLSDCSFDVVLNKVSQLMEDEICRAQQAAAHASISTIIRLRDAWDVAGLPSMNDNHHDARNMPGGRLVATWCLAAEGHLSADAEVTYYQDNPPERSQDDISDFDVKALNRLQSITRNEVDCQVCYALFHDPFTTGCGHTFCRSCLHRTLDHSHRCPVCRCTLAINPLLNSGLCPSNESITRLIELFWPDEKAARDQDVASDIAAQHQDLDLPLFVCTLAFPSMPTFLHIFEPRYRLMVRRALEGNRTFGMVLPKRSRSPDDAHFYELGTLLRIVNAEFYSDGRSLIETVGLTRFKVLRHGELDGYTVAKTERLDDMSLEEEEAIEAAEAAAAAAAAGSSDASVFNSDSATDADNSVLENLDGTKPETGLPGGPQIPTTTSDLQAMSTQNLMSYATAFVARMRGQSVPWLTARMFGIYGECPSDPAVFPWWFASMLPVKDLEKYRLLGTYSVRERLKICCSWILEWETTRW